MNPGAGDVALLPAPVGLAAWAVVIALGLFHIYTITNNPSALSSSVWGAVTILWAMFVGAYARWQKY